MNLQSIPKQEFILCSMHNDLVPLIEEYEKLASYWNGKDPTFTYGGTLYTEDAAHCANDIVSAAKKLRELLSEMNECYG